MTSLAWMILRGKSVASTSSVIGAAPSAAKMRDVSSTRLITTGARTDLIGMNRLRVLTGPVLSSHGTDYDSSQQGAKAPPSEQAARTSDEGAEPRIWERSS